MKNRSKFLLAATIILLVALILLAALFSSCAQAYALPLYTEHNLPSGDDQATIPTQSPVSNEALGNDTEPNQDSAKQSSSNYGNDSPMPAAPQRIETNKIPGLYKTDTNSLIMSWEQLIMSGVFDSYSYMLKVNFEKRNILNGDLVLPNGIFSVDFTDCNKLTGVTLPSSVTSVDFYNCKELTYVTLSNNVQHFATSAFYSCNKLQNVYYEGTVADWCRYSFYGYTNPCYYGANLYFNGELVTNITIPSTVDTVGDYLFYYCKSITSVTIENGVKKISNSAFANCRSLKTITIPNTVTTIDSAAFFHCDSLKTVVIPNSVTTLGKGVFSTCINLESVTLPKNITRLDNSIFYGCKSLKSIRIPVTVTWIGSSAFNGCTSLEKITYDGTIKQWYNISSGAICFKNTSKLTISCVDGSATPDLN